ncbi:putative H(+)-transporting two-sector ATPase subunit a [Trichinella spiralis]|uniref:putative H(+)-transporting two-sector ATPase subunit a n=1 Tax=Trichinella spiralis TaxID=6334 RepID=UPI0001EFBB35|nr:putative H(+)-transporting two-sector ATPase subunit a [Trichinella spiralis]
MKRTGFNPAFVQRVQYRPLNPAQFADDDQIDHDKTEHVDQDEAEVVVSTDDEIVEKYTDNFADQRIGGGVEFVRIRLGDGDRIPYGRYGRVDDGDRFDADMFDAQQAVDFHQHQLEQMLLVEQQSRIRSIHRHGDIRYVTADGRHHVQRLLI